MDQCVCVIFYWNDRDYNYYLYFLEFCLSVLCFYNPTWGVGCYNCLVGKKAAGSCCNMLLSSFSLIASRSGIYNEQILIARFKVTLTAIARCWAFRLVLLWGMSFLISIETLPGDLWPVLSMIFFIVMSWLVLRNVPWMQKMAGLVESSVRTVRSNWLWSNGSFTELFCGSVLSLISGMFAISFLWPCE